ncbi:hypothetical protein BFJ69_g15017 [Fusarium oxysporum]|uniref:Uncharacterized protein n=1 Tax=Fusarium oxysporum TaxID=5507 RepID=A0A420MFR1_FUSOX|nr:hypothetical protein BFJ69_g15017 [Fusarium oxysporum]
MDELRRNILWLREIHPQATHLKDSLSVFSSNPTPKSLIPAQRHRLNDRFPACHILQDRLISDQNKVPEAIGHGTFAFKTLALEQFPDASDIESIQERRILACIKVEKILE